MPSTRPRFFATREQFRDWLEQHHASAPELLVGFYKRGSGRPSLTWPESVDQALCFGWIDGVRRRIDDERYSIRFTPRRPSSLWSTVNINRVAELDAEGLMRPAGRAAFARRADDRSNRYSYEQRQAAALDPQELDTLKADAAAWTFFASQAPWYRRTVIHRVITAKRPETRQRRLAQLIAACAAGKRISA